MIWFVISAWLLCGVIGAGGWVAELQEKYGDGTSKSFRQDLGVGLLFGLMAGPWFFLLSFFGSGFFAYGWRLWRKHD